MVSENCAAWFEKCESWLSRECGGTAFLVPSATAGLEIACRLVISPGDEVIVPSFSHPSCSNSVILAGGIPVYADVSRETLNLDEGTVWGSLSPRTKAIMPIYYGGVSCGMEWLNDICSQRGLTLIEDAAHCIGNWKLGGEFGVISFHSTKNVGVGEGGVLVVYEEFREKTEVFRDLGADRAGMMRGDRGFYSHVSLGTSGRMSSNLGQLLWPQLLEVDD